MTPQEIKQASKGWADNFDSSVPNFAKIKQQTAEISYRKGAEMVNSRQPYTAEYMASFARFVKKRWTPIDTGGWVENDKKFYLPHNVKTDEQVIKLWEESKNG